MGLMKKIMSGYSKRQIRRLEKTVNKIEDLAEKYTAMSEEELRAQTDILRARLSGGETLDDILPDAFALVRETADRVLGKRPFRVQLIGGIILHQGRIAEMKTGEGKTLVATMPAYLNALSGRGVHIVTVNDYLARTGADEMGRIYSFLGLKTGLVVHGQTSSEKRSAYQADITYGTNNEFGFDYLRDNMVIYKDRMVQRGHAFAIVDEVDSILIDEARTPLIISGQGEKPTDIYEVCDRFARSLTRFVIKELDAKQDNEDVSEDCIVDEKAKNVILTKNGIAKAEKFFNLENLSDPQNATLYHHINQAIRAHGIMHIDDDYVVKDGEIVIVDAFTGRLMPGRRYNNGLHQAIEAKEKVKIQRESKTLATITFQNYFRMYSKLSGMTGTAFSESEEFREIYALDVVEVPTNKPMIRHDHNDAVYTTRAGKYRAIVAQIKACHEKGQPVLVGTISIEKSEELSRLLQREGIRHTVLNAKFHEREAEIVAQAGKEGAVTISTNMAGRGTDIMLGGNSEFLAKSEMRRRGIEEELIALSTGTSETDDEEILSARALFKELNEKYKAEIAPEAERVRAAGGLYILGTERHESRRIDNQLRGRSGRQGDPGESRFFISFEDDLIRLFGNPGAFAMLSRMGDENTPLEARMLSSAIESAQKRIEADNFEHRKHVLNYDDVMNQQRKIIYNQRRDVLDGADLKSSIQHMISECIEEALASFLSAESPADWNLDGLRAHFMGYLADENSFSYSEDELEGLTQEKVREELESFAYARYESQEALFTPEAFREVERVILLRNVDSKWMDHIDMMDDLKGTVGLNAYAQRNPLVEYRIVGADMFDEMVADIRESTVRGVLTVQPTPQPVERVQVAKPLIEGFAGGRPPKEQTSSTVVNKAKTNVGRNDPCPCGSGKKYKKCCGANADTDE